MAQKSVIVIGGGLAGLSAAAELSARGYKVTVLEKGGRAGGKLTGWRDEEGESLEHGMHGWWFQYFNFFDLMKRVGIPADVLLEPLPACVVFEDGGRQPEPELTTKYPTPLFLFKLVASVRRLSFVDMLSGTLAFARMFAFDHARDYERYDSISAYAYADASGVSRALHDMTISPFSRSFAFDSSEGLSIASVMSALSFYMIGHQEDVTVRWCRGNPQELILDPLVKYIEAHGGEVRTGVTVSTIESSGDRIDAVRIGGAAGAPEIRVPLAEVPSGTPLVKEVPGMENPLLLAREGGNVRALSARCTHRGCSVAWQAAENAYVCPCHGGKFGAGGEVLGGPPHAPLDAFDARVEGSDVVITPKGASEENLLRADDYILATEVSGMIAILRESPKLLAHDSIRRMLNLGTTEVLVARLWTDRKVPKNLTSGVFAGTGFLDNFFILSNFQDDFLEYDGSVIEVQMYVVKDYIDVPADQLLAKIKSELESRVPELAGMTIRKFHIGRHRDVFTHFNVGAQQHRPGTTSPLRNLYFAGDWVRLEKPWWMMEKAVTSGKLAANEILRRDGDLPQPVFEPRPDALFTRFMKRASGAWRSIKSGVLGLFGYKALPPT